MTVRNQWFKWNPVDYTFFFLKKESFCIQEVSPPFHPTKMITSCGDLLGTKLRRSQNKPRSVITESSRACLSSTREHHSHHSTWVAWELQLHTFRERLHITEFHVFFFRGDLVLRNYSRVFILLYPGVCVLLSLKWKEWFCGLVLWGKPNHRVTIQRR